MRTEEVAGTSNRFQHSTNPTINKDSSSQAHLIQQVNGGVTCPSIDEHGLNENVSYLFTIYSFINVS
jgi:hypothetical protein